MTLDDLQIMDKKVLVRVDFNVPITDDGKVRDFTRMTAAMPTIHNIIDYGGSAILMSHLGRPKGERNLKYTLRPVAEELANMLGQEVKFAPDCIGPEVEAMVENLKPGEVILLENVRFHPGEDTNDPEFAAQLAKLGDVYVDDAFGAAHRAHASIHAITRHFPGNAVAGRLMMREISFLSRTLLQPARPFVGVVGGAKVSSKIKTVKRLVTKVNKLLIGGGMTFTLIKSQGGKIGDSLFEPDYLEDANEIYKLVESGRILLPEDTVAVRGETADAEIQTFPSNDIPDGWRGLDIGPKARELYKREIKTAKTVLWNGPMGLFEVAAFAAGTRDVARALIDMTSDGGISVVGGGDSTAALRKFHLQRPMTHISTGGGSLLEFIEGKTLPGIEVLTELEETI